VYVFVCVSVIAGVCRRREAEVRAMSLANGAARLTASSLFDPPNLERDRHDVPARSSALATPPPDAAAAVCVVVVVTVVYLSVVAMEKAVVALERAAVAVEKTAVAVERAVLGND